MGEEIEALRRVAGDATVALIHSEPDGTIVRIVDGWPRAFDTAARARPGVHRRAQGFDEIVRVYIEDEMGGVVPSGAGCVGRRRAGVLAWSRRTSTAGHGKGRDVVWAARREGLRADF